ncbi:hypothetical protein B0T10DRAFT_260095 [Thelonectria olida]|uniref:Uncharacterized protein n=1 Tax=Thelonectria olida TaxID=1576542 RepID=A0A9P9AIM7_9HYPO|nr:hypothetical protein B0T10DRAFT_260095 [Thelonectria olida]
MDTQRTGMTVSPTHHILVDPSFTPTCAWSPILVAPGGLVRKRRAPRPSTDDSQATRDGIYRTSGALRCVPGKAGLVGERRAALMASETEAPYDGKAADSLTVSAYVEPVLGKRKSPVAFQSPRIVKTTIPRKVVPLRKKTGETGTRGCDPAGPHEDPAAGSVDAETHLPAPTDESSAEPTSAQDTAATSIVPQPPETDAPANTSQPLKSGNGTGTEIEIERVGTGDDVSQEELPPLVADETRPSPAPARHLSGSCASPEKACPPGSETRCPTSPSSGERVRAEGFVVGPLGHTFVIIRCGPQNAAKFCLGRVPGT